MPSPSPRVSIALLAVLAAWAAAACAPRGDASTTGPAPAVHCLSGETCGYLAPMFRSANCCGYAVGPFPDALACRSACAEYAASAGRGTSDCNLQGQRQCDAPSETWLPCDAASGARAASGRCTLATGRAVSCVCR